MTIKDLAAQTGYSVGTVSRVLNRQSNVSQKAREAITQAAAASGFQLNANAKQLKQHHGTSILVVAKGRSNELFSRLVELLQSQIADYPLVVDYAEEREDEVLRALRLCQEKKPLGIVFLGGNRRHFLENFGNISLPSVLVTNDASDLPFPNLSSVSSDNVQASRMAAAHLIALGHRKIALIGGCRTDSDTTAQRYQGCLEAFQQGGVDFDPERDYAAAPFSFAGGYQGAQALMTQGRGYTAIFAMSDVMAIGAVRAVRDMGLAVPEDVSVVGFDGLAIGDYTVPRLTTVSQPVQALAQRSAGLLLDMLAGGTAGHEILSVTLEQRESAGTPNR